MGIAKQRRSYAFVLPRFGEGIFGGAETLAGSLAAQLSERGDRVEVFTTCARDNRTWTNEFEPGTAREFGLPVHRFPVDDRNLDSWIPKQIRIAEGMRLSVDEQLEWMADGVNSRALYATLNERAAEFDALFFAPYLFATTFWGSLISPKRALLIPCLHDENYAYLEIVASMFGQVRGALFNTLPEGKLARSLYGEIPGGEVGMGFEPISDADLPRIKPYFAEPFPYIAYLGRKETGKNVQLLIDYFINLKESAGVPRDLKLVIMGGGDFADLEREGAASRADVVDLSNLSEEQKRSVLKFASILVQPSVNESFSIVIMEAWRLGVPVMVDSRCAVTRHHVEESGGGLYYEDEAEFCEAVKLLSADGDLREKMGAAGRDYTLRKYSWAAVLNRFDGVMEQFLDGR